MNVCDDPPAITRSEVERMLAALLDPACYPHPVRRLDLLETHISWVILTGDYAYKIKKPVNLGFLDFTSLASRRHYCEEELRLNRRLAPGIYLEMVTITGDSDKPCIGGAGPALEYAVKMREFPQSSLLDATLARGEVNATAITALAQKIAAFHATASSAASTPGVDAATLVLAPALENFRQMLPSLDAPDDVEILVKLREWTLNEHGRSASLLCKRLAECRVRECHGDLHLGNIVLLEGKATPFDCIEFNPALRWMDVISEVAFLIMDLEAHDRRDLAYVFLNTYLEDTGDYNGVAVLPFYRVYRAVVRAKISLLRAAQTGATPEHRASALAAFKRYLTLATDYIRPRRGAVIITHGLSGSGKTSLTTPIISALGAVRIRSDVERKRLHGVNALAPSLSMVGTGIYNNDASARTYDELARHAKDVAGAGFPAIVDATFLKSKQRETFRALALELDVPFVVVSITTAHELLRSRISARAERGDDASEATLAVLEAQIEAHESLSADERRDTIEVDTGSIPDGDAQALCKALAERILQKSAPWPNPNAKS